MLTTDTYNGDVYRDFSCDSTMTSIANPSEGEPIGGAPASIMQKLYDSLQQFAKDNNFVILHSQAHNVCKDDATKSSTTYTISCTRDDIQPTESRGICSDSH
ncbi:hypothetical protein GGS21DRAFT_489556 [Xylaria nigripes]|nr:hypothetical protein GGS21DRAFT_489556 [Xylaria nigripes]